MQTALVAIIFEAATSYQLPLAPAGLALAHGGGNGLHYLVAIGAQGKVHGAQADEVF